MKTARGLRWLVAAAIAAIVLAHAAALRELATKPWTPWVLLIVLIAILVKGLLIWRFARRRKPAVASESTRPSD